MVKQEAALLSILSLCQGRSDDWSQKIAGLANSALARKPTRRPHMMSGAEFYGALDRAKRSAVAEHGPRWSLRVGCSEVARIPSSLAQFKTERGTTIKTRRDIRIPAAHHWPDQRIPDGVVLAKPYVPDPAAIAWMIERSREMDEHAAMSKRIVDEKVAARKSEQEARIATV
jgi:hypothetical protein